MYGRTKYIVIALVAVLVVLLGVLLFHGGKKPNTPVPIKTSVNNAPPKVISAYNTPNSYVRLTIDGQINSDVQHRMIRITIAQNQSNLDIFQGYQYTTISSSSYENNQASYNAFLFALQNADFDKDRRTKQPNDAGVCPLGFRYIYQVFNDDRQVSRRWSTSCGSMGTFGGKTSLVNTLFKNQIPDYSKQTAGVQL